MCNSTLKNLTIFLFLIVCCLTSVAQTNNVCSAAKIIITDSVCVATKSSLTGQTLSGATSDGYSIPSACGVQSTYPDVWYTFVAKTTTPTITISNVNAAWGGIANVGIQLVSSANDLCGGFSEVACASGATLTPAVNNPLVPGKTYFVRIHRNTASAPPANCTFDICITDPMFRAGRLNEVFARTVLSDPGVLQYPWEITYGPDDSLWITEARGYKVYKMSSVTGIKRTVLDLSSTSTWLGASGTGGADTLYAQNMSSWSGNYGGWPQGGFCGLALHPQFGTGTGKDFVYVTYVWKYISGTNPDGVIYRNKLVRFTYNTASGKLDNPSVMDWNLPGSKDHNSQRLIIAPVAGTDYLFLGSGDMGAGQFENRYRTQNAQNTSSYEGKILRYNLDNAGQPGTGYTKWIPSTNPYSATSAVWSIGIRNNQGFAYDTASKILYGSSHGPYSDDEINIIEGFKNYGHPQVIGYAADGNYNGNATSGTNTSVSAGATFKDCAITGYTPPPAYSASFCGKSSISPVGNETTNANTINSNALISGAYKDPVFSAYPSTPDTILTIWQTNPPNGGWQSEGWSGLDLYSNKIIPGWKQSLLAAGLKWGRVIKLNLDATGTKTLPSGIGGAVGNKNDTVTYFQSTNRYRDLAFAPNGRDLFLVMDNSSATSGPGSANPTSPACAGCVVKYSFLGYGDVAGVSTIPKSIAVTSGTANTCNAGTTVTINGTNNFLWVPITGPDGNIMAEINAGGQNLGLVTSSFYQHSGAIRTANGVKYLNRNMTITPANTFTNPVKLRLYISKAELDALIASAGSGVTSVSSLKILKNGDACGAALSSSTAPFTPTNTAADLVHGTNGYVLQTAVSSFSSFYFAASNIVLPVNLISFNGTLQSDLAALLKWKTTNEINLAGFEIERSANGNTFKKIAFIDAQGNGNSLFEYTLTDKEAGLQQTNTIYYRLKILDKDGSYTYSNVVAIALPITQAIVSIAPNPATGALKGNILSPVNGNVTLQIFDNAGRMVFQNSMFLRKGNNLIVQDINQLSSGLYYINISGKDIVSRAKFQKL